MNKINNEENTTKDLSKKSSGKGILDLIREDSVLSKKITYEEAVLMNPSILGDVENKEEILKQIRAKYPEQNIDDDYSLNEAVETYLQTIMESEEKTDKTDDKSKSLTKNM